MVNGFVYIKDDCLVSSGYGITRGQKVTGELNNNFVKFISCFLTNFLLEELNYCSRHLLFCAISSDTSEPIISADGIFLANVTTLPSGDFLALSK